MAVLEIPLLAAIVFVSPLAALDAAEAEGRAPVSFEVRFAPSLGSFAASGRLFVILSRTNAPEPRLALGRTGRGAVHLVDEFLSKADPPFEGRIVYGARKPHGWSDVNLDQMLKEMEAATEK